MADGATTLDVGGYTGTSFRIHLEGDHLVYERLSYGYQPEQRRELRPTPEEWSVFWCTVEDAGVWGWRARYEPAEPVMDGTSWSLLLDDGTRRLGSSGSNAAPEGMRDLCDALSRLAAGAPFH